MRNQSALPQDLAVGVPARPPLALVTAADSQSRRLLAQVIRAIGFNPVSVRDGNEALERIGDYLMSSSPRRFALVLVDLRRRERNGLDLFFHLRHGEWRPPVILVVPRGHATLRAEADAHGALAVLEWPFEVTELQRVAEHARRSDPRR